jgi:hypothetical protein
VQIDRHSEFNCFSSTVVTNAKLVKGEGEETVLHLVDALANGKNLQDVPGIAYRDLSTNEIKVTAYRPTIKYFKWFFLQFTLICQ